MAVPGKCPVLKKRSLKEVGISAKLDSNMERKELSVFQTFGCNIDSTFIDDCHSLGKINDGVIFKFTRCKNCKQILKVKT